MLDCEMAWVLDEMETRNKGTKFIITKEANADLDDELGVQNICLCRYCLSILQDRRLSSSLFR